MDDTDTDEILTIEELRSLRDRVGTEAAAAAPVASAAQFEIPDPPAGVPLEAPADPWEDLRRRARGQRRWAGLGWAKPLAAVGCLAAAGGGITLLVSTGHTRDVPPPTLEVPTPASTAPSVTTTAPVSVLSTPESSIVLPVPVVSPAPSPPADVTIEPPATAVPQPRATYRPKPPASAKPPAARPSPAGEPAQPPSAADRAGTTSAAAEPPPTLTRTPTSWSPPAPE